MKSKAVIGSFLIIILLLVGGIGSAAIASLEFSREISGGTVVADLDADAAVTFTPLPGYESYLRSRDNGALFFDLLEALDDESPGGFNSGAEFSLGSVGNEVFSVTNNADLPVSLLLVESSGGLKLQGEGDFLSPGETGRYYFVIDTRGVPRDTEIRGTLQVRSLSGTDPEGDDPIAGPPPAPPEDPLVTSYDFAGQSLDPEDFLTQRAWFQTPGGFVSSNGLLFIENPHDTYTLSLKAVLDDPANASQMYAGYGLFFETTLDGVNRDSGYILQFDRQLTAVVVRPRNGGSEDHTLLRIMNTSNPNNQNIFHSDLIPTSVRDSWWTQPHQIDLTVTQPEPDSPLKLLKVDIDSTTILEDFAFMGLDSQTSQYTGFRSWSVPATYESLTITPQN
ncbi:MAG: hypothetical protein AVO33_11140 [delta proteobacterium ML8_F1]|nr:MAG: hypothetical protein AVO33_11140 [delta proteobacterium ML8_F1]